MNNIFEEIKRERGRQDKKFGQQNNNPIEWVSILMEELGEASKEAVQYHFKEPVTQLGITTPVTNAVQEMRILNYRHELIQIAAVAVQAIQCIDRNTG